VSPRAREHTRVFRIHARAGLQRLSARDSWELRDWFLAEEFGSRSGRNHFPARVSATKLAAANNARIGNDRRNIARGVKPNRAPSLQERRDEGEGGYPAVMTESGRARPNLKYRLLVSLLRERERERERERKCCSASSSLCLLERGNRRGERRNLRTRTASICFTRGKWR
jgi:hypothetical protein